MIILALTGSTKIAHQAVLHTLGYAVLQLTYKAGLLPCSNFSLYDAVIQHSLHPKRQVLLDDMNAEHVVICHPECSFHQSLK